MHRKASFWSGRWWLLATALLVLLAAGPAVAGLAGSPFGDPGPPGRRDMPAVSAPGGAETEAARGVPSGTWRPAEGVPVATRPEQPPVGAGPDSARAAVLLAAWDRARSRAYARGNAVALRRLYVQDSVAGRADVRLLRAYLARGLRVRGLTTQLLAVEVRRQVAGWMLVRVTDRLAGGVAVGPDGSLPLPRDEATTRLLVLVRAGGSGWQIASVRPAPPGGGR